MVCLGSGTSLAAGTSALAPANQQAYQELSAKWWQWTLQAQPSDSGPFGVGPVDCGQGQPAGNTWFLVGQFSANAAERHCTVPATKRLFFPLANVMCTTLDPADFLVAGVKNRHECLDRYPFVGLAADLDGQPLVSDFEQYRVSRDNIPITSVPGNPSGIPAGQGFGAATGIYLLLAPLSPGKQHVLHFKGSFPEGNWAPEATYYLTVA
jgi:hypothetical protein